MTEVNTEVNNAEDFVPLPAGGGDGGDVPSLVVSASFRFDPPEPRADVVLRPRLLGILVGRWEHRVTVWIGDTIDHLRIHPDNKPCTIHMPTIVMLVPATDKQVLPPADVSAAGASH